MIVNDLLNIYDSINRDISKLKSTINSIPADREYSNIIQNTILSEIEKFENLKTLLLSLEIEVPEDYLANENSTINLDYTDPSFFPSSV